MKSRKSVRNTKKSQIKPQKKIIKRIVIALLVVISAGLIFGSGKFFPGDSLKTKAQSVSDNKNISPEAVKQIEALTREKESRTETQKKIDSRLLYQIKMMRGEAIADGVPALRTNLKVDEQGFVEVDISANVSDKLLAVLKEMNAEIIASFPQYHSITARLPLVEIENLAARPDIIFIQPKLDATTNQKSQYPAGNSLINNLTDMSAPNYLKTRPAADFETRADRVREFLTARLADDQLTGTVNSEADTTHRAGAARTIASVNGAGLKIGVLSDGVNSRAARQASGNLPAGLTVLAGQAGSGDEGTAMLELVYDLAPGAQLYFATAFTSITSFAQNIKDLRTAGCDIIIDDVSYYNETPFQDGQAPSVISPGNAGIVVQAVNDVTIGPQAGALYFSSAANSGNKNDNTAGAWEGDFVNGGTTGAPFPVGNNFHNFGGGVTQNVLLANGRVTLKWSDPLGGSGNDYDLYILNSAGTTVVASSANVQSGTQDPYEDALNCFTNERVVIVKKAAAANRFLHLNTNGSVLSVSTTGTIYGHNGGVNTISVAAAPAGPAQQNVALGPFPNAHSATNVVEQFSSDGPRRIFYNADSSQITPGNVSSTGGNLLLKPDITAADGTSTTTPNFIPFFGTSAAAPHAGALMALLKQASPASNRTQLYNAMINSAIDIEAPGYDRDSGYGIFMPLRAMNALSVAGPALLETGTITTTQLFGNGNGRLEPGESANLILPLNNLGLANATGITATLSTSTPGVTILNTLAPEALAYPNIPAVVGSATPATPFSFGLAGSFACGTTINFTLTVNYAGGAAPSQVFNFSVATTPSVTTTLDATLPPAGGGYTAATGTQTGRLVRNGVASTCAVPKAAPAQQDTAVGRRYDAYTFTAQTSGCTTVALNGSIVLFAAAYNSAGFVPGNTTTNYVADAGLSGSSTSFSFNAIGGLSYTIVVHEVNVGGGLGTNYTLNISGPIACALAPTAASVTITGRVASNDGRAVRNAIVTLVGADGGSYNGRTNSFGYYTIEGVPAGETYTASVLAKGLVFTPQIVNVADSVDGLNFTAEP